jgi:hypothetical protein
MFLSSYVWRGGWEARERRRELRESVGSWSGKRLPREGMKRVGKLLVLSESAR